MAEGDVVFRRQGRTIVVCRHGERKGNCPVCATPLPPVPPMQPLPFKRFEAPRAVFSPIANARAALAMLRERGGWPRG